jgi:MICOS complex subunit MIC26
MFWTRVLVCPFNHVVCESFDNTSQAPRGHRNVCCRGRRHRRATCNTTITATTTKSPPKVALLYALIDKSRADIGISAGPQLSIYPEPEREIVVLDCPSVLETHIGAARKAFTGVARDVHARVHGVVSQWIGIEHAVERTLFFLFPSPLILRVISLSIRLFLLDRVKALVSPNEPLTPALLYVGVASLGGSILARNRSVFTRVLLPPTFFLLSCKYFLPKTTHNVAAYAGSLEEEHFPALAQKHAVAIAHTHMTWERLRAAGISGRDQVQHGLGGAVRKVQELTGLKVHDALGRGAMTASKAVEEVEEALQSVKSAAAEAGKPAEKAVEEKVEHQKA